MKKKLISFLFILAFGLANGQQPTANGQLSPSAFASLMTCGAGDEFYENYGHSALRICDSVNNLDVVFNYGTFDFDVDHFYLRFAHGSLDYHLAVYSFNNFMFEYSYYGRAVWEQRLLLNPDELNSLYSMLMENAKPENKYYKYDFFRDNCATRIDDAIMAALDTLCGTQRSTMPQECRTSYRDLLYKYNTAMPWWKLGTDILLGARCDRPMDTKQFRYIPFEMMNQYDTLVLADGRRLTECERQLLTDKRTPMRKGVSPTLVFWLLFAVIAAITLYGNKRGWKLIWLDAIIFGSAALISLLLLYLWFGSNHWCTKWNLNLLWANPLLWWPLLRLRKPKRADSLPIIAMILLMIVGLPFWPQHFNSAVIPIALIILVRLSARLVESGKWKVES
jgi:hypothetical protein